jgi:putative oxidoreductase
LVAVMTAAVITVHWAKGLWSTGGGYEYNLVLAGAAFALAAIGAGNWSLDHVFSFSLHGVLWGIGALVVGALGGIGAVLSGRLNARRAHPVATQRPTTA